MNRMHDELLTAISQLTLDTNQKYNALAKDILEIKETSNQMNSRITKAVGEIDVLKKEKAEKEDLQKLAEEMKVFRNELDKKYKEQEEKIVSHENRLQGLSNAVEGNRAETASVKHGTHKIEFASKLESDRIRNVVIQQEERLNILELEQNKLHLNIDGVPENTEVNPALLIITKFNTDTKADLKDDDIKSAWRVGIRIPEEKDIPALQNLNVEGAASAMSKPKRKPRTISVILASDEARDKIMANRSKLKKYEDGSYMWINEDQPEAYRRRKSMLRDLVKLARKKRV